MKNNFDDNEREEEKSKNTFTGEDPLDDSRDDFKPEKTHQTTSTGSIEYRLVMLDLCYYSPTSHHSPGLYIHFSSFTHDAQASPEYPGLQTKCPSFT
ncbi:hypothetical protein Q3G72_034966 [Acer saccharum]|nr:hypothetical protein Q3G72_034966 [Acer saccharum]